MHQSAYDSLLASARYQCRGSTDAEDLLHEALIEAVRAGRGDLSRPEHRRWLMGVVRNKARMAARSAHRRRQRETAWHDLAAPPPAPPGEAALHFVATLPPALKAVAALALSGHTRREIGYLLRLDDAALRQRVVALKKRILNAGIEMPAGLPGLGLDLAYGRIRDALLPALLREGGIFASHDPDGHLFVVRRSQSVEPRQLGSSGKQRSPA